MEKSKKEQMVVMTGLILILIVIAITLFRSNNSQVAENTLNAKNPSKSKESASVNYPTISAKELQKKILLAGKNKGGMTLLDIRPFEDYINEHIIDSLNAPLEDFPLGNKIDARTQLYIIAANNQDPDIQKVIAKLKEEDVNNPIVLDGGMEAWKQFVNITVNYGNPKSFEDQSKVNYADAESVRDALVAEVPMYILDTRSSDSFAKGHLAGAVNIPFDSLEKRRSEIKEKKIVVIGSSELEEFQASVQLYDMLLASPYIVRGAMPKWQEKGFPVVK